MITAIIVDDEEKSLSTLTKFLLDYCPEIELKGTANNISDAKELIEAQQPQLVFLDIEMPYGTGFDLLDILDEINFETIFVTAYSQYAIDAFRYSSIDYLLKPVNIEHLKNAVKKAEQRIEHKMIAINYQLLLDNLRDKKILEQKIQLSGSNEQYIVKVNDILYCIADRSYTLVYMSNKRKFHSSKNLKYFEEVLSTDIFCRIHHSHLININHIARIVKGPGGSVVMNDGAELEISIRRKDDFLKMIK